MWIAGGELVAQRGSGATPALEHVRAGATAFTVDERGGAGVDVDRRSGSAGERFDACVEATLGAGQGELVALGEVEHDVADAPALATGRALPPRLVQRTQQRRQLGVLLGQ